MSAGPVFSVVIPVFNKWELTRDCLLSLAEQTPEYPYEVIVVDNGSSDDTASQLRDLGSRLFGGRFTGIRFEENRNFGPACNAGAKAASAPLLFFLNNDTLLRPGWAPPLVRALEDDPGLGAVGPLLLYEDNTVQHLGVVFSLFRVSHLYQGFPSDHPVARRRRDLQAVTAAALMTPRELFLALDGFYEEYQNGFEDVDFCLRMRGLGKRLTCVPESVICHLESQTPGRKTSEQHNGELLQLRCGSLRRTDEHIHGLRDGFLPFLTDKAGIGLRMKDKAERDLAAQAEGREADYWFALTRKHPLWVLGREHLAQALEREGLYGHAIGLRHEAASILGSAEAWDRLCHTAEAAGNRELADEARSFAVEYAEARRDKELFRKALRTAVNHGDRFLRDLCETRMKEFSS